MRIKYCVFLLMTSFIFSSLSEAMPIYITMDEISLTNSDDKNDIFLTNLIDIEDKTLSAGEKLEIDVVFRDFLVKVNSSKDVSESIHIYYEGEGKREGGNFMEIIIKFTGVESIGGDGVFNKEPITIRRVIKSHTPLALPDIEFVTGGDFIFTDMHLTIKNINPFFEPFSIDKIQFGIDVDKISIIDVPEPATAWLFGAGLIMLVGMRKKSNLVAKKG